MIGVSCLWRQKSDGEKELNAPYDLAGNLWGNRSSLRVRASLQDGESGVCSSCFRSVFVLTETRNTQAFHQTNCPCAPATNEPLCVSAEVEERRRRRREKEGEKGQCWDFCQKIFAKHWILVIAEFTKSYKQKKKSNNRGCTLKALW